MSGAIRILIIEDNPANLELMRYLLVAFGYEVSMATSGAAGLDLARALRPCLVICDVQMPGKDGYSVARDAKADPLLREIPLLAVTALAMAGDRERALAAGFNGHIAKPIDPETFVQSVEAHLMPQSRSGVRAPRTGSTASPPRPATKGRRILILDNLQANLDLSRDIFEYAGYEVVAASSVAEALALARRHGPDLIVSDVCMPEGSGHDFIRAVKAEPALRSIPFVFVTSTATTDAARERGLAAGAVKFLFRPLESGLLLAEVEACLRPAGES